MTKKRDGISLHEAMIDVLIKRGPMTAEELASRADYIKEDYSAITAKQILARVRRYPNLFTKKGNIIYLK